MRHVAIIGAGPAGLMAAEAALAAGASVSVLDAMPSVARKFLMAGKSGLNISHTGSHEDFAAQYQDHDGRLRDCLSAFGPEAVVGWMAGLGMPAHAPAAVSATSPSTPRQQ